MQEVKINTPYAYQLLISVSDVGIVFWAHHKKNDEFLHVTAAQHQNLLTVIEESINISEEFSAVKIVYSGTDVAIVPNAVFEEGDAETIFKLTNELEAGQKVLHAKLPNNNATVLFAVDTSMHKLLRDKFAGAEVYHELGVILNNVEQPVGHFINIRLNKHKLTLAISQSGKLLLANSFSYGHSEEAVYFVLNACEQLGIDPATANGNIINASDKYWNTMLLLKDYCPNIKTVNMPVPEFDDTDLETGLLLYNLAKCE